MFKKKLFIDSPVSGNVWQMEVVVDQPVKAGEQLMILESMKMEIPIHANVGQSVKAGQALVVINELSEGAQ